MLFPIALIIAFTFAFFCGKALKKYPYIFYSVAALLTVAMAFLPSVDTHNLPIFVNTYILGLFTRGALATALWCVVMTAGAFPNGSVPIKKLMPIRGELSIFTAILTLGHNIGYGRTYFTMLFTNRERMSENQIYASICTIIMLAIMIPLTVMSFPKIRKKMNAHLWKKIQRTAYLFYALIYIHVMLLTLPMAKSGREGYIFSVFIYSLVFFGYAYFRIRKFVLKKEDIRKKTIVNVALVLPALMTTLVTVSAGQVKENKTENNNESIKTFSISTTVSTETNEIVATESVATISSETNTATTIETITEEATESITETTTEEATESITEITTEETTDAIAEEDTEKPNEPAIEEIEEEYVEEPYEEEVNDEPEQDDFPIVSEQETTLEPQYIYNNGNFSASAYGYDGDVHITITIENDVIISISGYTDESDSWYFNSASGQIIPAILNSQNADVDAYSGATYSSDAIMQAVKNALDSARK